MAVDSDAPNGTDIKDIYPIEDIIFEVDNKSLTNRPDLWGIYGIAREFAALTGRELKPLDTAQLNYSGSEKIPVSVLRPDLVYRYSCIKMDNITKQSSPAEMSVRLYYCGMRPINLLADLTNYIMLEIGQPTHAFDARKINNIVVKTPEKPTKFTTLDKVERDIDENTLMICNGDEPVAIAGIMGGLDSEIIDGTSSVVLESACFDGIGVRKTSSRLGHRTDSSARYEKMLDPELTLTAVKRFVKLVSDIDSGAKIASQLTDEYVRHYPSVSLTFDKKYVDRYTGIDISDEQICKTLTALGFAVKLENEVFTVDVPSWRATKDVTIKADIIEEITRIYGYDNFKIETTRSPLKPVTLSPAKAQDNEIKDILVKKFALHEVHSYIWCDGKKFKRLGIEVEDHARVLNIESSDNGVLRNSMLPTLLCAAYENKDFDDAFGMFEIGRVVNGIRNGLCNEEKHLGIVLFDKACGEKALYFKAVELVNCLFEQIKNSKPVFNKVSPSHSWQHPRNTAEILAGGSRVGTLCALHPQNLAKLDKTGCAVCVEIDLGAFGKASAVPLKFSEPSPYQSTYYDLSLVLKDGVKYSDIEKAWLSLGIAELTGVKVIDTFERMGIHSVTVRLFFSSQERTLEMDEVQGWIDCVIANLAGMGIALRS